MPALYCCNHRYCLPRRRRQRRRWESFASYFGKFVSSFTCGSHFSSFSRPAETKFRCFAVDHLISRYRYVNNRPSSPPPAPEKHTRRRVSMRIRDWFDINFHLSTSPIATSRWIYIIAIGVRVCVTLLLPFPHEYTHTRSKTVSDNTWRYCVLQIYCCTYSHLCKSVFRIFLNSDISVYS